MYSGVMDAEWNPLRKIPDLALRHLIMQILAWMWCIIFSLYFGIISIPKNLFVHFIKGRYDHMKYFMIAVLWNIGYKKELKF